ncbi:MAG: glycosyltransferase [bacterium]
MKKILLVSKINDINGGAGNQAYTYASSFERVLRELGHDVCAFNCKRNFLLFGPCDHDKLSYIYKKINNFFVNYRLKKQALAYQPDIVFFIKAENITHKTIKFIKYFFKKNIKIFNFYPDNPFSFWNGNSNKNILLSLPVYDCFLIWSKQLVPVLMAAGCKDVYYFPFAYDENLFKQDIRITSADQTLYASDICFIGTWDADREFWLTQLCQNVHVNFALWGNSWDENLALSSILRKYLRGPAIYSQDMIKAFSCSKINLNFVRTQNMSSHNMRTFEVLASGAFLLTQRTQEQIEAPFEEGGNIECFGTHDELVKKIAFYLKNDTIRKNIACAGRVIAVRDFTLQGKLTKFFEYLDLVKVNTECKGSRNDEVNKKTEDRNTFDP